MRKIHSICPSRIAPSPSKAEPHMSAFLLKLVLFSENPNSTNSLAKKQINLRKKLKHSCSHHIDQFKLCISHPLAFLKPAPAAPFTLCLTEPVLCASVWGRRSHSQSHDSKALVKSEIQSKGLLPGFLSSASRKKSSPHHAGSGLGAHLLSINKLTKHLLQTRPLHAHDRSDRGRSASSSCLHTDTTLTLPKSQCPRRPFSQLAGGGNS